MAGAAAPDDPLADVSPEERARIARAAKQLAAYANFLRWCGNFPRDEVAFHPANRKIALLSLRQSARFSYAIEDATLFLGVQPFEAAWVTHMPFEAAYVSDRLYLQVNEVACMGAKLPALSVGIHVNSPSKRAAMGRARALQPVRVRVRQGHVVDVDSPLGAAVPITSGDVVKLLAEQARQRAKKTDITRLF